MCNLICLECLPLTRAIANNILRMCECKYYVHYIILYYIQYLYCYNSVLYFCYSLLFNHLFIYPFTHLFIHSLVNDVLNLCKCSFFFSTFIYFSHNFFLCQSEIIDVCKCMCTPFSYIQYWWSSFNMRQ